MGRASRRQQRAKEELQELALASPPVQSPGVDESENDMPEEREEEGEEEEIKKTFHPIGFSAFNALSGLENDKELVDSEASDDDGDAAIEQKSKPKKKKNKKKPKKKPNEVKSTLDEHSQDRPNHSKPKLNTKQGDGKVTQKTKVVDEIEEALRDIAALNTGNSGSSQSNAILENSVESSNLFLVDAKMLDAEQELRRMFGSRVISSATSSTPSNLAAYYGTRTSNNPHHQLNLKSKATMLSKPLPSWGPYNKSSSGLSMRALTRSEIEAAGLSWSQESWFCFEHSVSFRALQSRFIGAILSLDPNQLFPLLRILPYHPDTLLQLSEVFNDQGDPGQSLEFLNRALYGFEKSFHPMFNLTKSECRLDFKRIENRGFFRTLEKRMQVLMKRGCWRASLETCKLLLALNPYRDPYGALLWVDLLAFKAKQYKYLLELVETLPKIQSRDPAGGIYTEAYPGLYYSTALCLKALLDSNQEAEDLSTIALEAAILRFPQVIIPLGEKVGLELPPTFIKVERAKPQNSFSEETDNILHLQSQIYVTRSSDLWKDSQNRSWLQSTIDRCHSKLLDTNDPDVILGKEFCKSCGSASDVEGIYRSVFVSDVLALKKFLPPRTTSSVAYSFDPWPPSEGTFYDEAYFGDLSIPRQPQQARFLRRQAVENLGDGDGDLGAEQLEGLLNRLAGAGGNQAIERGIANQLIEQIQVALVADDDVMNPPERQALLERLDAIIEIARQQPNEGNQEPRNHAGMNEEEVEEDNRDLRHDGQDGSFEEPFNRNVMPGSFWDEELDSE